MAIHGALGVAKRSSAVWAWPILACNSAVCAPRWQSVPLCRGLLSNVWWPAWPTLALCPLYFVGLCPASHKVGFLTANKMGERAAAKLFKIQDFSPANYQIKKDLPAFFVLCGSTLYFGIDTIWSSLTLLQASQGSCNNEQETEQQQLNFQLNFA